MALATYLLALGPKSNSNAIKIEPFIELSKAGYSQEKGHEILYDRLYQVAMVLIDVFKTQSSQSNPETKKC